MRLSQGDSELIRPGRELMASQNAVEPDAQRGMLITVASCEVPDEIFVGTPSWIVSPDEMRMGDRRQELRGLCLFRARNLLKRFTWRLVEERMDQESWKV